MRPAALILAVTVAAACGPPPARHYYTLTTNPPATKFDEPFPIKLRVRELDMRRSYRRDELVFRSDAHELSFQRSRRWSEPPQRMISGIIRDHVRRSNLATDVQDDSGAAEPDYILGGEIEAVEQINVDRERYAHLAIVLRLVRAKDEATVWTYKIDARRPVTGATARATVRVLSEILAEETDAALTDLGAYLENPDAPRAVAPPPTAKPENGERAADVEKNVIGPEDAGANANLPQLGRDDTQVAPGLGAIFAPTLSDGDREPLVAVYQNGNPVAEGKLGKRIPVPPGEYEVRVGSGAVSQQIATLVRVVEGKTTIIPPSWAALDVAVVDETFLPFRGTYELIAMANREEYGLGFGADEQLGEVTRVWVLPPGLYKLIRAGGTYRDRTNFATVRLEAGWLTRFTLVLDPDDGSFRGAGENDPDLDDLHADDESEKRWVLRAVLGGDLNFNRSEEVGAQQGWKLSFNVFFDGQARLQLGQHLWTTRLELEEGQTRILDKKVFQNDTDRLFAHTIYIYQLWSWFGPYVRFGLETKLLPRHQDFDAPRDVDVLNAQGEIVRTEEDVERVRLGGLFAPVQLKEGAGGNFRVLRSRFAELDLRLGFGARQTLVHDLFVFEEGSMGANGRLIPVVHSNVEGLEGTLVGLARVSSFATISTELDGLAPIFSDDSTVFTWRNQISLRLVSFISLSYRFNATRDPNLGIGKDIRTEHDVQLRFSYVLF